MPRRSLTLTRICSELSARRDELREEIDALTGRENDLRRREAIIARKAADPDARETALRQKTESFRARSEKVLSEISRQKEEVRRLISARLG
ncbi:MAG: hypothetical protein J6S40_04760 [Thermoguttaceae bacterium]|nr:hypothetical protein [Thermoguttaceae bacterium]